MAKDNLILRFSKSQSASGDFYLQVTNNIKLDTLTFDLNSKDLVKCLTKDEVLKTLVRSHLRKLLESAREHFKSKSLDMFTYKCIFNNESHIAGNIRIPAQGRSNTSKDLIFKIEEEERYFIFRCLPCDLL